MNKGKLAKYKFRCGADLDCFMRCCTDVNVALTPYDILRLKRALRIDSTEFLHSFTISVFTREHRFPVVLLRMDADKRCPFLNGSGCSLYSDRPWACRMYPLGGAAGRRFCFPLKDGICRGYDEGPETVLADWVCQQGAEDYEVTDARFRGLILHPFWRSDRDLTAQQREMFYLACYDFDRFRRFVFDNRLLYPFQVDEARIHAIASDDEELLEFAIRWLRFTVFGDRTLRLKSKAAQRRAKVVRIR